MMPSEQVKLAKSSCESLQDSGQAAFIESGATLKIKEMTKTRNRTAYSQVDSLKGKANSTSQ